MRASRSYGDGDRTFEPVEAGHDISNGLASAGRGTDGYDSTRV